MALQQGNDKLVKEKSNFDEKKCIEGNWEYHKGRPHSPFPFQSNSQFDEFKQILDKMDEILKMVKAGFNQNGYIKSNGLWVKL